MPNAALRLLPAASTSPAKAPPPARFTIDCMSEDGDRLIVDTRTPGNLVLSFETSEADYSPSGTVVVSPSDAARLAAVLGVSPATGPAMDALLAAARAGEDGPIDTVGGVMEQAENLEFAAGHIAQAFAWADTREGDVFWSYVTDRLRDLAATRRAASAVSGRAAYLSPCPPGYGTVLGHVTQQGGEPEDAGMREGQRLARLAKEEGVSTMWVGSGAALKDVCDRVRAYPESFLAKHLGPVVAAFVVPPGLRPVI